MRFDVTIAGLNEQLGQRVKLAAQLLAAHKWKVTVRDWDGTRCHALVAPVPDAYGRQAVEVARRRGYGVVVLYSGARPPAENVVAVPADSQAAAIAAALKQVLEHATAARATAAGENVDAADAIAPRSHAVGASQQGTTIAGSQGLLLRLARDESLLGRDVHARLGSRRIALLPSRSRVIANTLSDLLAAREQLLDATWEIAPLATDAAGELPGEVSVGLDAFLAMGAVKSQNDLPEFPDQVCALRDWPDLGSAPEALGPLRIANCLMRASGTPRDIARKSQVRLSEVSATLWAFKAAGLLLDANAGARPTPSVAAITRDAPKQGLLQRLAARFGLSLT
jgi:hypothetical protein